jgi:hypothetical protein
VADIQRRRPSRDARVDCRRRKARSQAIGEAAIVISEFARRLATERVSLGLHDAAGWRYVDAVVEVVERAIELGLWRALPIR